MDVIQAIRTEPIVSDFLVQTVPIQVIQEVLAAGQRVQSNFNSEPWRFVVVEDLDRLRALSECVRHPNLMADAAFAVIPVTNDTDLLVEGQIIAYMQLAAWDFKIASHLCPIVFPEQFRLILSIPDQLNLNTAISFGIPAPYLSSLPEGNPNELVTASLVEAVRWEHW
jgi:nitroreductase